MKFKLGDRVVISRDSEYYGRHRYFNPTNSIIGKVVTVGADSVYTYRVQWFGNTYNSYREEDLVFADAIKPSHGYLMKFNFV